MVVLLPRVAFGLDDPAREHILASQTRLAAALLARAPTDPSDGAVMVSPASLAGMLSPLTIAGDEAHRAAMAEVLQIAPGATRLDDLDAIRGAAIAGTLGDAVEASTRFVFARRPHRRPLPRNGWLGRGSRPSTPTLRPRRHRRPMTPGSAR